MAYVYDDSGEHETLPSRDEVLARIDAFRRRIDDLYDHIQDWFSDTTDVSVERGGAKEYRGPIMDDLGMPSVSLPTLTVRSPGRSLLIYPTAVFMIGGNGALSVVGPRQATKIIDAGTDDAADWRIYPPDDRLKRHPLTRDILLSMLEG